MSFSLDSTTIEAIQVFEKITGAQVKDTFEYKDRRVFVLMPGNVKKALGKDNKTLDKLEKAFNSKIKLVEFSEDVTKFIVNFLKPLKISSIVEKDAKVHITGEDQKTQGLIIGAKAQNLRGLETIVQKYFKIEEITVGENGKQE
jgi:NusA-like KH domain protein